MGLSQLAQFNLDQLLELGEFFRLNLEFSLIYRILGKEWVPKRRYAVSLIPLQINRLRSKESCSKNKLQYLERTPYPVDFHKKHRNTEERQGYDYN